MFSKIRTILFGSDISDSSTAPQVRVVSATQEAGPPTATAFLDEIAALQSRMAAIRAQLEATNSALASASNTEHSLGQARAELEMECHDAWLHPQICGLYVPAGRSAPEVWSAHLGGTQLSELRRNDTAESSHLICAAAIPDEFSPSDSKFDLESPSQHSTPLPAAEAKTKKYVESETYPTPGVILTEEEQKVKVLKVLELLWMQREAVGPKFAPIAASLHSKREALEDRAFTLEMRLLEFQGEEQQLQAMQRVLIEQTIQDVDESRIVSEMPEEQYNASAVLIGDRAVC